MAKETCLENEFITIWYHADTGIVHHEWHKFFTELLRKHNVTKWLSDDRKYPVLTADDSTWAEAIWFPKTVSAGWKYWAIVMPHTPIGQINIGQFVKNVAAAGITVQIFSEPDEAMKWLEAR